jgi:diguanylate cyclase (GGDEF)-like protein
MITKVYLREENIQVDVAVADASKPSIHPQVLNRWQRFLDIIADLLQVPAALIMRITPSDMEVFLASANQDNPYQKNAKDNLGHGLYCETVIGRGEPLLIPDATTSEFWKDNPDIKLHMIAYYGIPLKWSDDTTFGTICALDHKPNEFDPTYRDLMNHVRDMIEQDLEMLEELQHLEQVSGLDALTGIPNRRTLDARLHQWIEAFHRHGHGFALALIDLDGFKQLNDTRGHVYGDTVLRRFAQLLEQRRRATDVVARYGGDEFLVLLRETDEQGAVQVLEDLRKMVSNDQLLHDGSIDFSYGVIAMEDTFKASLELLEEVDRRLYRMKDSNHRTR